MSEVNGSYYHYQEFEHHIVWMNIKREINYWIEDLRNQLEQCPAEPQIIGQYQGRIEACRKIIELPALIRGQIEASSAREDDDGDEPI